MFARFKSIKLSERWVFAVLGLVAISAFGLLLPKLGYYWDDWMTIYLVNTYSNPGEFVYAAYRPLHAVWDVLAFKLLGNAPFGWHVLALLFRWGAASISMACVVASLAGEARSGSLDGGSIFDLSNFFPAVECGDLSVTLDNLLFLLPFFAIHAAGGART